MNVQLGQRFEMLKEIGRGAQARVLLVKDKSVEDHPLRVVKLGISQSDLCRMRFHREFALASKVTHDNVVRLFDEDRLIPFICMEYYGETCRSLGAELRRFPSGLPSRRALPILVGMARGISAAHRCGIIHRDIKPDNVLVFSRHGSEGLVLTDFGIGDFVDPPSDLPSLTRDGSRAPCTPRYASPEQLRGEPAQPSTDLFSLGMSAVAVLTGQLPIRSNSDPSQIELPAAFHHLDRRVQEALSRLLDPDERMRGSLDAFLRAIQGVSSDPEPAVRPKTRGRTQSVRLGRPRNGAIAAALIVGGLTFAGSVVGILPIFLRPSAGKLGVDHRGPTPPNAVVSGQGPKYPSTDSASVTSMLTPGPAIPQPRSPAYETPDPPLAAEEQSVAPSVPIAIRLQGDTEALELALNGRLNLPYEADLPVDALALRLLTIRLSTGPLEAIYSQPRATVTLTWRVVEASTGSVTSSGSVQGLQANAASEAAARERAIAIAVDTMVARFQRQESIK